MADDENNVESMGVTDGPERIGLADNRIEGAEFATEGSIDRVSRDPEAPDALGETELGAANARQETTNHTPVEGEEKANND